MARRRTCEPVDGQVVAVHDGDTLTVQSGASLYKVRLSDVDAPEMGQVFGKQARDFTKQMVLGRRVRVNVALIDKHDRRVGEVIVEDGWVLNEELVHAGLAWYYRVHPIKNQRLQRLEHYAFTKSSACGWRRSRSRRGSSAANRTFRSCR